VSASGVVEEAIVQNAGTLWFSAARGDIPGPESPLVSVVVVRSDTITKHPDDAEAMRAAPSEALDAVRNDHAATGRLLKEAYFPKLNPAMWDIVWNTASGGYPASLAFPRGAYEYWICNDPKGLEGFRNVDYARIVYAPAQSPQYLGAEVLTGSRARRSERRRQSGYAPGRVAAVDPKRTMSHAFSQSECCVPISDDEAGLNIVKKYPKAP